MGGEIARRSDSGHAHVGTDPHRDHVLRDGLAEPHARIEPLRDDVDKSRVHAELDLNVGIGGQQLGERGPDDGLSSVDACRDADRARRLVAQLVERGELRFDAVEIRTNRAEQPFSRVRRNNASRRARQQPKSEPFFQLADCVAERRRRDADLRRGAGETPLSATARKASRELMFWRGIVEQNSKVHAD